MSSAADVEEMEHEISVPSQDVPLSVGTDAMIVSTDGSEGSSSEQNEADNIRKRHLPDVKSDSENGITEAKRPHLSIPDRGQGCDDDDGDNEGIPFTPQLPYGKSQIIGKLLESLKHSAMLEQVSSESVDDNFSAPQSFDLDLES